MDMQSCSSCGRQTGHKRALGWGTFFMVILTAGFWIFTLPFYPKRCIICGEQKKIGIVPGLIMLAAIIAIFVVIIINQVKNSENKTGVYPAPRVRATLGESEERPSYLRQFEDRLRDDSVPESAPTIGMAPLPPEYANEPPSEAAAPSADGEN